jgi:acyl carrier protein
MSALKHKLSTMVPESHGMHHAAIALAPDSSAASPEEMELAQLIVATLNLEVAAAEINPTASLYREGLGLDSIDVLELALVISKTYGLQLRSDDENNLKIFSSLRNLNGHIQQHRTKGP